jgi:hypothetical protein
VNAFEAVLTDGGAVDQKTSPCSPQATEVCGSNDTRALASTFENPSLTWEKVEPGAAQKRGAMSGDGFARGMRDATPAVYDASAAMAAVADEATRHELKIQSPSRVMSDHGMMVGAGFVDGIERSAAEVDAAVARAFTPDVATGGGGSGSGTGRAPITVHVETNVTGAGGDAAAIGQQVATQVQEILPGALQSALEQMDAQMGGGV